LFEVITTLRTPRSLTGRLDGGQEKGDQDADDGNDNQEFHQRETALTSSPHGCSLS
jgi:hypothetical protein